MISIADFELGHIADFELCHMLIINKLLECTLFQTWNESEKVYVLYTFKNIDNYRMPPNNF